MSYSSVVGYTCQQVHVNFKDRLGSGSYGIVYRGKLDGSYVAVKIIEDNRKAIKEANRMERASGHANILELIGTVSPGDHYIGTCHKLTRNSTWLVMEYMEKGNLFDYMRNYAGGIPASGMIKIAYQVALGMDHLHRNCNMLHMDLAARNVLVQDDDFNIKIGDFGLCKNLDYSDQYYNGTGFVCPARWMPSENYPSSYNGWKPQYSRKGDVYSYGVLLFEIWSRGKLPFAGFTDTQVMQAVESGTTVLDYHERDFNARWWVKDLMRKCLALNKEDRPNFRQIYNTIHENEYASAPESESEDDEDYYSSEYDY